jgi:hypothetical protein
MGSPSPSNVRACACSAICVLLAASMVLVLAVPAFGSGAGDSSPARQGEALSQVDRAATVQRVSDINLEALLGPEGRPIDDTAVREANENVAERYEERAAALKEALPQELLPVSLKEQTGAEEDGAKAEDAAVSGGAAAGWTVPALTEDISNVETAIAGPWDTALDSSGNLHLIVGKATLKEFSAPIGAQWLYQQYHTVFSNGSWSPLTLIGPAAKNHSTELMGVFMDGSGCLQVVYRQFRYLRYDTTWGTWYQPGDQRVMSVFRGPDGSWSKPKALADFKGLQQVAAYEAEMSGGDIHLLMHVVKNLNNADDDRTSRIVYLGGSKESWGKAVSLASYTYNYWEDGEVYPVGWHWPRLSVSPVTGEVAGAFVVERKGSALKNNQQMVRAALKDGSGKWGKVTTVSKSGKNEGWWVGAFNHAAMSGRLTLAAEKYVIWTDENTKPHSNIFVIRHEGKWAAQKRVTSMPEARWVGQVQVWSDYTTDDLAIALSTDRLRWDGDTATWIRIGSGVRCVTESNGKFTEAVVMKESDKLVVNGLSSAVDRSGRLHLLFARYRWYPGTGKATDYAVLYSADAPDGAGGGFSGPDVISKKSDNVMEMPVVSCNPLSDVVATWREWRRAKPAGVECTITSLIRSRLMSGGNWGKIKNVNSDLINGVCSGSPRALPGGEQVAAFTTRKLDMKTARKWGHESYFDYKLFYAETRNGEWQTPELVSNEYYNPARLLIDANNRAVVLSGGGRRLMATMQTQGSPSATVYYFAEGTTRTSPDFDEWLCLQNPGDQPAQVNIDYLIDGADNVQQVLDMGPSSRRTVDVAAEAVGEDKDLSAVVTSTQPLVAERPMYFDVNGWTGGHDAIGSTSTGKTWFFAEGTTRPGFSEYLTVANPTSSDTVVEITYMLGDGTTVDQEVEVKQKSRSTVDVKSALGEGHDVSVMMRSVNSAIVAERPMYFDYHGWTGGHVVMGGQALSDRWYFAEGTTREGFDTYLCLQNPHDLEVDATVTYIMGGGEVVEKQKSLGPTSRETVKVNDDAGAGRDVSIMVEATAPVLAERPMYFDYHGWCPGGSNVLGTTSPKNSWYFAEGTTREGFEEWLSIQNPGALDATVSFNYMLPDGSVISKVMVVGAQSRATVDVNAAVGTGQDVSVAVWSDRGIIVERPMYFDYRGQWTGGHDVIGL